VALNNQDQKIDFPESDARLPVRLRDGTLVAPEKPSRLA